MKKTIKPFRCAVCKETFTELDAFLYNFFKASKVCFGCYNNGQKADHREWCFGKRDKTNSEGVVVKWGHDPKRIECKIECPDRRVCAAFLYVRKNGKRYRKIDRVRAQRASEAHDNN